MADKQSLFNELVQTLEALDSLLAEHPDALAGLDANAAKNLQGIRDAVAKQLAKMPGAGQFPAPDWSWKERFDELYSTFQRECLQNTLGAAEGRKLAKQMQNALDQGAKELEKYQEKYPQAQSTIAKIRTELNARSTKLGALDCNALPDVPERFVPHEQENVDILYRDRNMEENYEDFSELYHSEYGFNKTVSKHLMTDDYIESVLHELKNYQRLHKDDINEQEKIVADARKKAQAAEKAKSSDRLVLAQAAEREEQKLDRMRGSQQENMSKAIDQVQKDLKEARQKEDQAAKKLKEDGLSAEIERNKGNIPSYINMAYLQPFIKLANAYMTDCNDARRTAHTKESMNRIIAQVQNHLNDAMYLGIINSADQATVQSYIDQMQQAVETLQTNCSYAPAPNYSIMDSTPEADLLDKCDNPIHYLFTRTVTVVPNPTWGPQTITYSQIVGATQTTTTVTLLPNGAGGGLPATALASGDFNLSTINTYFQNNPAQISFSKPLGYGIPAIPPPIWYEITDMDLAVTEKDACGNPIKYTARRVVKQIPNPDCGPSRINYISIIAAKQEKNPILLIGDQRDQDDLPDDALSKEGFDLASIQAAFEGEHKGKTEYSTPLNIVLPEMPPPPLYEITDSVPTPLRNRCGDVVGWRSTRTVKKLPNPDCIKDRLVVKAVYGRDASRTDHPELVLSNTNVSALPSSAQQPRKNATTVINLDGYFGKNPDKTTQERTLQWNFGTPPFTGARSFPITVGYWDAVIAPASLTSPSFQQLIRYLQCNEDAKIQVLGMLDYNTDGTAFTDVYDPADRARDRIPAAVTNPVDYIFVKGANLRTLILSTYKDIDPSQIIAPRRGDVPNASLIIGRSETNGTNVNVTLIED